MKRVFSLHSRRIPRGTLLQALGLSPIFAAVSVFLLACPAERRPDEDSSAKTTEQETEQAARAGDEETGEQVVDGDSAGGQTDTKDSAEVAEQTEPGAPSATARELVPGDGRLFGVLRTNQGNIVVRLLEEEAPVTVANFVGLATGKIPFQHHETNEVMKGNFYDGTIFHRVIPQFMIQGGDPTGTGRGGPGYRFKDERQSIGFDRPGLLAMANAGPNTNGSQFFITEQPTPHLTGRHTIFGTVEQGMDVVRAIARVSKGAMDRPNEPVVLEQVEIIRAAEPPSP